MAGRKGSTQEGYALPMLERVTGLELRLLHVHRQLDGWHRDALVEIGEEILRERNGKQSRVAAANSTNIIRFPGGRA